MQLVATYWVSLLRMAPLARYLSAHGGESGQFNHLFIVIGPQLSTSHPACQDPPPTITEVAECSKISYPSNNPNGTCGHAANAAVAPGNTSTPALFVQHNSIINSITDPAHAVLALTAATVIKLTFPVAATALQSKSAALFRLLLKRLDDLLGSITEFSLNFKFGRRKVGINLPGHKLLKECLSTS